MTKLLLSVSLIALSAAYVAAQNNWLGLSLPADTRLAADVSSPLPAGGGIDLGGGARDAALTADAALTTDTALATVTALTADIAAPPPAQSPRIAGFGDDDDDEDEGFGGVGKSLGLGVIITTPPARVAQTETAAATAPAPAPRARPAADTAAPLQPAQVAAAKPTAALFRDGTFVGSTEDAYYGTVQVQVSVTAGKIARVTALDYPQHRRTSRRINQWALPVLEQEVVAAQSSRVNLVSGATLTSRAYVRSLASALAGARPSNA